MEVKQPTKKYKSTNTLVYSCQYHVIFCPKYRRKVLTSSIATRLKELILEKQDEYGYQVLEMEIMSDHVHLLLDVNPQIGIWKVVGRIKGYTRPCAQKRVSLSEKQTAQSVDSQQVHLYRWCRDSGSNQKVH